MRRLRRILGAMTLGAVIIGITLSTLHQSGLGALFLMAKSKIHPLWYSEFIPVLFFVSSIFAGLSMVIFEGTISQRVFRSQISPEHKKSHGGIVRSLAKICGFTMLVYLFLKELDVVHGKEWTYLNTPMGYWYLVETIGFVLIPCLMFLRSTATGSIRLIQVASILALVGIILNRLNVSIIAFKWYDPVRYFPSWMEIEITLAVIAAEIWVFRWVVNRMPVLREPPAWAAEEGKSKTKEQVTWTRSVM
jgi:Ni/Fe-hydrogenase subunit HybB-like protein